MIIGFAGKAGSGKDTAALALINKGWFKYSFAQPIRDGLEAMFGIPQEDMFDVSVKNRPDYKYGRSIRYLLQTCGTEFGRNLVCEDVWIQRAIEMCSKHENVVIADVRFENEARAIREEGGIIIEIVRYNPEHEEYVSESGMKQHISEMRLPVELIDVTIVNDGDIIMLWENVLREADKYITKEK